MDEIIVVRAVSEHEKYAQAICDLIYQASKEKDAGLAQREPNYIVTKMREGKAVIALAGNDVAGYRTFPAKITSSCHLFHPPCTFGSIMQADIRKPCTGTKFP
mgnify:CR=1 FL=1